jgi:hypothetical protein
MYWYCLSPVNTQRADPQVCSLMQILPKSFSRSSSHGPRMRSRHCKNDGHRTGLRLTLRSGSSFNFSSGYGWFFCKTLLSSLQSTPSAAYSSIHLSLPILFVATLPCQYPGSSSLRKKLGSPSKTCQRMWRRAFEVLLQTSRWSRSASERQTKPTRTSCWHASSISPSFRLTAADHHVVNPT